MERLSRSQFVYWLRTGRVPVEEAEPTELKFNPNHDPKNGQFTFAGEGESGGGGAVLRTMGLPVEGVPKPASSNTPKVQTARSAARPQASAGVRSLKPIRGYSETGASSWRRANDEVFIEAADKFNKERGLKPGDPKYVDPQFIKAWAMVESGGGKAAFLRDPLQVNNAGDWSELKGRVTGLTKSQQMTPASSAEAALKWLESKGYLHDKAGRHGPWRGFGEALRRYNGKTTRGPGGVPHSVWYARQVLKLYDETKKQH